MLVDEHKLEAVVKLPSGVFKPYAGVSTAILLFTKTGVGGTENVWFYDIQADGYSLDDKRTPLLPDEKLGVVGDGPRAVPIGMNNIVGDALVASHDVATQTTQRETLSRETTRVSPTAWTPDDHAKNNLPDVITRWALKDSTETHNPRTAQSFCVPKADIVAAGYDLSLNRYKETKPEEVDYAPPKQIIAELRAIETEITNGLAQLEAML
jgi:type I restriction enzyme M protein